jgi:D-alanine-D-alanine ligase-like ATP-grasp enzyme
LVLAGNFEVENEWAAGQARLPTMSSADGLAIVNRMDEFALLLGSSGDRVLLKAEPDPDHLDHLHGLGFDLPRVHVVSGAAQERSVTADALADPATLRVLRAEAGRGAILYPHGTSPVEQLLAGRGGIPLAGASAAVCRTVNSKVFSRRLADRCGLRQPAGFACSSLAELADAVERASTWLAEGPVVVKEAYGVSGKGLAVVDSEKRLRRILRMIAGQSERGLRVDFTVERWVRKSSDLNYQVSVDHHGGTSLDVVKTALTEGGVHRGHRMPATLGAEQLEQIEHAAHVIGRELYAVGYTGVVGVDALVEEGGSVHPVIEINARNNMATYQLALQERLVPEDRFALARHYGVTLSSPVAFREVRQRLADLLLTVPGRSGVVVNNFATVNAAFATSGGGQLRPGRLYTVLVAATEEELRTLDEQVAARLSSVGEVAA